jgi:hypothetical protein
LVEEAIETTIVFIALIALTIGAMAYAGPKTSALVRLSEADEAQKFMIQFAEDTDNMMSGDTALTVLPFNFQYGTLSLSQVGETTVTVDGNEVYSLPNYALVYKMPMPLWTPAHALDKGSVESAYYNGMTSSIVYHYSGNGNSYVQTERKLTAIILTAPTGTIVQIVIGRITTQSGFLQKKGALSLSANRTILQPATCGIQNPCSGQVSITMQDGLDESGQPLTSTLTIQGSMITVFLIETTILLNS